MTLAMLIRKRDGANPATATPAIPATQSGGMPVSIARVATIAVASSPEAANRIPSEALPDPATEARHNRVCTMLRDDPGIRYAAITDDESDPANVIVSMSIRGVATFDMLIPREKWDGVLFLQLLERHSETLH